MLETFTIDTFSDLVGDAFTVRLEPEGTVELRLTKVARLGEPFRPDSRVPFSLQFDGPAEVILNQANHAFDHAQIGAFEMFLVPVGADTTATHYEAVFS